MFSLVARRAFSKVATTTPGAFTYRTFSEKLTFPTADIDVSWTGWKEIQLRFHFSSNKPLCYYEQATQSVDTQRVVRSFDDLVVVYLERLERMVTGFKQTNTQPSDAQMSLMHEMAITIRQRFAIHSPTVTSSSPGANIDVLECEPLLCRTNIGGVDIEASSKLLQKEFDELKRQTLSASRKLDALEEDETFSIYQACIQNLAVQYDLQSAGSCSRLDRLPTLGFWSNTIRLFEKQDTKSVRDYKTKKALRMLENMNGKCRERFSKRYGETFITDIIRHFNDYDFSQQTTDQVEIKIADDFWRRAGWFSFTYCTPFKYTCFTALSILVLCISVWFQTF